jgi:ribonuclease BN (tRNA processing enzyme)
MKLIFLGSGSAFTVGYDNYHSNMILEYNGKKLLIDCGSDARHSMNKIGLSYQDIDAVYVSHLHADHVGGLEWLGFTRKFDTSCDKPTLFINELLAKRLWNHVLSGSMQSFKGWQANLNTYFKVHIIKSNKFNWCNIEFSLIRTCHVYNGENLSPSYGLIFDANGIKVFITTDTIFLPAFFMKHYKNADIIFHECELGKIASGVHTHYSELTTLASEIKKKFGFITTILLFYSTIMSFEDL